MELEKLTDNAVEIEANYYLMKVFNAINESKSSAMFSYKGIKFWREEYEFVTEQKGLKVRLGQIVDFEEFKGVLGV